MRIPLFLAILGTSFLSGCDGPSAASDGRLIVDGDRIEGAATVRWENLEGGFFILRGADGEIYEPMNLPEAYREDGLRVFIRGTLRPDVGSILMMGTPVELEFIEPR